MTASRSPRQSESRWVESDGELHVDWSGAPGFVKQNVSPYRRLGLQIAGAAVIVVWHFSCGSVSTEWEMFSETMATGVRL
jgi:hypothetical protein